MKIWIEDQTAEFQSGYGFGFTDGKTEAIDGITDYVTKLIEAKTIVMNDQKNPAEIRNIARIGIISVQMVLEFLERVKTDD